MRKLLPMATLAIALLSFPVLAQNPQASPAFREGVHYLVLPEPVPVEDPDKIEVTEVFWYGCSHCFRFEPLVLDWKKDLPEDVNFVQVPAMWSRPMETHARAYYTARQLGILEDVHQAIYDAINVERKRLNSAEEVAELFARHGAEEEETVRVFNSAETTALLKEADTKARGYQITGTPQLIVHGRYRIQSTRQVPHSKMFEVADFLVDKVRAERAAEQ
ncbi:thiol:disulfide interchange protein DsbA/DsbL [Gilvimarinus sp. F26214L]|uniref:thiol:disulfide interchange protein DsbA/DsbL n=1 Tax=Gilvimarinus sp. DZF01 TaxID=3461371 RepID=UPI0040452881